MVMFKARFQPLAGSDKPRAADAPRRSTRRAQPQQQQQPQPQPQPTMPPIEDERGPQAPVREPEPRHEPERAL